ncbi:MAG: DNA polymerase III subunit gamma/tau, partial [Myxococcales bacterium]|nr:DNA polymerase III subunit gamma/tau [Myxococcales bacterium]
MSTLRMAYTVLARKHRPQRFSDLVGQEHVTRTIGNAIESGRVAHAYLFTGARGVGKTSTARLLAKALNCAHGPTTEPCNACDPCLEITAGNDLDVLEIDGASNNSVEDVRRLQESLPYRPNRDRFKVVIVDEVHMLSSGAFNAFLKTLEEPPSHVKFIFATTEIHKVPITIRSRCQRHDFRLIPHSVVAQHVRDILAEEGIDADDSGIAIVAREAAGSMRDALTVLDQVLAFGDGGLRGEEVTRGLGIAGQERVLAVAKAILDGDPGACLRAVHELAEQGLDVLHFARQLLTMMRNLVVLKIVGDDPALVTLDGDERAQALEVAAAQSNPELERSFLGVSQLVDAIGMASEPRLSLEMGLVRLADRPRLMELGEVFGRLDAIAAGSGPNPAGSAGPTGTRGGRSGRPSGGGGPRREASAAGRPASPGTSGSATPSKSPVPPRPSEAPEAPEAPPPPFASPRPSTSSA